MSPGRVESGEAFRSTVTRSENRAQSLRAFLSVSRSGMGSAHSKRRLVSKWVHWRQAWIGTRQFGHCSSDAVAIGRTAPHAPHRETVCLASIPPPRGASDGGGGGDGRFGSPPWFRYPCCRYFRSDMLVVPFGPLLYPMPVAGAPVGREACPNGRTGARLRPAIREFREDSMKLVL